MENHFTNTRSLIEKIKDKIGKPVSSNVVAAAIESLGIREQDTMPDYGFKTIKDLAELVYYELTNDAYYIGAKNEKEIEFEASEKKIKISDYLWIKTKIFFEYYSLGLFHLLPVLIQIIAIVLFGYSLWTFVGFNQIQSTAVILGVIIGLISTGGFVQVIGRQASFYWNFKDYQMTKKTINYLHKVGMVSIFISLLIIYIINSFLHIFPYEFLFVTFIYAFLIGMLLLFLAPIHTIKRRWVITLAVLIGTVVAVYLKLNTVLLIYATHWIGISIAIIIAKIYVSIYFYRLTKNKKSISGNAIKVPVVIFNNYHYFFYGMFIYIFIFTDRILAWSTGIDIPFIVYFEKNYEIGMDLAIIIFLLLSGVLEFSIASFTRFIDIGQKLTDHKTPEKFNNELFKMYMQQLFIMLVSSLLAFVFIYFIINAPWGFRSLFNEKLMTLSVKVSIIGGIGYVLLAWGMLNSLYLFTLGQALVPLKAIIYACTLNICVGFILSRFISYEYSVVGMLCGSALFVLLTLKANLKFLKNLDYYYYAAY